MNSQRENDANTAVRKVAEADKALGRLDRTALSRELSCKIWGIHKLQHAFAFQIYTRGICLSLQQRNRVTQIFAVFDQIALRRLPLEEIFSLSL